MARGAFVGVTAVAAVALIMSGCTNGPAPRPASSSAAAASRPVMVGPTSQILQASPPRAADVGRLQVHTVPQDKRSALVRELMTLSVPTYVQPLATAGTFRSGAALTVAGRVTSPTSVAPRTALLVLRGPGYEGHHQVSVATGGIVSATLTLPRLTTGDWVVAIEDLSHVQLNSEGVGTGYAVADLADFPVS
jgi:hypothetical protein